MDEKIPTTLKWLVSAGFIALLAILCVLVLLFTTLLVRRYLQNRFARAQRVWARVLFKRHVETDLTQVGEAETTAGVVTAASATPVGFLTAAAEVVGGVLQPPGSDNLVDFWINFLTEQNRELELSAREEQFQAIEAGQEGWLTYQGEWLKSFAPAARPENADRQPASGISRRHSVTPALLAVSTLRFPRTIGRQLL